jgi:hypothetical protein
MIPAVTHADDERGYPSYCNTAGAKILLDAGPREAPPPPHKHGGGNVRRSFQSLHGRAIGDS